MWTRTVGATLRGVQGMLVSVEVDAGRGLPTFQMVGQADAVVREGRDRVRAAFRAAGLEFPAGRVTVNLAPTDLPKSGSCLDLAIAAAVAAVGVDLPRERLERTLLLGELGLDGTLRSIRGALPLVAAAEQAGLREAVVPVENLGESSACAGVTSWGAPGLGDVITFLRGGGGLERGLAPERGAGPAAIRRDLSEIRGQEPAKRALEIAAAGGHNLLLVGPPGGGKTLLAQCLPGLLPDLEPEEAIEVSRIHSVAGTLGEGRLVRRPPFRAPHHTASDVGLIGGGRPVRPGELTLAHRGVLFLDELPEFRRSALEALREPLEEGVLRIVRAEGALRLPARFQLIAAMNPCPCGFRGEPTRECVCDDAMVRRYRGRISGPLLDRIDLHVAVPPVPWEAISRPPRGASATAGVRARVLEARARQAHRRGGSPHRLNAELPSRVVWSLGELDAEASSLLERASERLRLSARSLVRILRVARTIADLDGARHVGPAHVAEAVGYRLADGG